MKHLDDAKIGELGVFLVVGEEDAVGRADALGGKLHDEKAEVKLLLDGVSFELKRLRES